MPKKSYKFSNKNKSSNKSELQAKGDSVVLTSYKKVDDGVSVAGIKETQENMGRVDKLNKKFVSELQAKGDSVVLTSYKKVDDGVSVAGIKETQENMGRVDKGVNVLETDYSSKVSSVSSQVVYDNSQVKNLKENLKKINEGLEQLRENVENNQKYLSEKYMKFQEVEKEETGRVDKGVNVLETDYSSKVSSASSQVVYDNSDEKELKEKIEKVINDLDQFQEEIKNSGKNLSEKYTKFQEVEKEEMGKDNKDYSVFLVKRYNNGSSESPQVIYEYDSFEYDNFDYDSSNEKELGEELEI